MSAILTASEAQVPLTITNFVSGFLNDLHEIAINDKFIYLEQSRRKKMAEIPRVKFALLRNRCSKEHGETHERLPTKGNACLQIMQIRCRSATLQQNVLKEHNELSKARSSTLSLTVDELSSHVVIVSLMRIISTHNLPQRVQIRPGFSIPRLSSIKNVRL